MTKLLTIGLILLSCGVALVAAGEHKPGDTWQKGDGCNTCQMDKLGKSSCTVMYCYDSSSVGGVVLTCEQKMKEAMRIAEKHQGNLWSQFRFTTAYSGAYSGMRCVTVKCLQKELDAAKTAEKEATDLKQAKIRWDAIYQECVK